MAEKNSISPRREHSLARQTPWRTASPFTLLERFADEMDRVFDDFGFGRTSLSGTGNWSGSPSAAASWVPAIEVHQRNNDLIVRADVPGLRKEDIHVDVTDDAITISGERRHEQEGERAGVYRSERSYGSFHRTIPLPEGAIADQAKATFKDGVLEIIMPAPPEQVTRGRRLEIQDGADAKK